METYLGTIKLFPYSYAPMGWMLCNGGTLNINSYAALYTLIGIKYGGNGTSTFQIPNMTNGAPISPNATVQAMAYYIAVTGLYPSRS
jgi:microcystin-dependent protein